MGEDLWNRLGKRVSIVAQGARGAYETAMDPRKPDLSPKMMIMTGDRCLKRGNTEGALIGYRRAVDRPRASDWSDVLCASAVILREDPCWVEVELVRGVALADLGSHRGPARAQSVQPALAVQAAAASVVAVEVEQQVWRVVGVENDAVPGTRGDQEPVPVGIGDTRPSGKHRDAFVRGQKRRAPRLRIQSVGPLPHGGPGPAVPVGPDPPVELRPDQYLGELDGPGQRAGAGGTDKNGHASF